VILRFEQEEYESGLKLHASDDHDATDDKDAKDEQEEYESGLKLQASVDHDATDDKQAKDFAKIQANPLRMSLDPPYQGSN